MCGQVDWDDTYSTMLAVCAHIADENAEDAALLLSMYLREAAEKKADPQCVYPMMFACMTRIALDGMGDEATERLNYMIAVNAEAHA
jgi:hypothetical protein